ncbi:DHHC palmitoyltransferase-domain-containing protein [Kockovaella imperatae]|uniref:Palmitoyltransferase n=1 Tax=Kockovaella imperatae TaxID=4999 RepID=A0A1Y1U7U6_9TREE|nr:DHHC palmitoyltransferase-domain-containing protein [Kockovaella imperatae]ORX34082.1 DHHC palmitoyltransferase-domain-containing protein [Kockovaella imperatae]
MTVNEPTGGSLPMHSQARSSSSSNIPKSEKKRRKWFGTSERRSGQGFMTRYGPSRSDPWPQRYIAVFVLCALIIWSFYVVVGRVCTPMIRNDSSVGFGRAIGIGTMITFIILWLVFVWSYMMILIVGPGLARDHCPKMPAPPSDFVSGQAPTESGPSAAETASAQMVDSHSTLVHGPALVDTEAPEPSQLVPISHLVSDFVRGSETEAPGSAALSREAKTRGPKDEIYVERPVPLPQTGPRWCRYCEINKPDRAHHCRHCGTCVMQFDHHCPWIGQCVGWRNHTYFIIFTLQASIFCSYLVIWLVIVLTKMPEIDGQVMGLLIAAAIFGLFAGMMYSSHVYLIIKGVSTVESYKSRDQREHEDHALQAEFGTLWKNHEKRKVRKRWKEEWGGVEVDARWKWGNSMEMWEQEMGTKWIGWFLPLGRPQGDGIHFKSNPRFGPNGEWLKKKDWPKELQ